MANRNARNRGADRAEQSQTTTGSGNTYITESINMVPSFRNLDPRGISTNTTADDVAPQPNYAQFGPAAMPQQRIIGGAAAGQTFTADRAEQQRIYYAITHMPNPPLSLADRMQDAADFAERVARGEALPDGTPLPDMLTDEERVFYMMGGQSTQVGVGDVLTPDNTVQMPSRVNVDYLRNLNSPLTSNESKATWLALHAPSALAAIVQAGYDPRDIATVSNVYMARFAADQAVKYWDAGQGAAALQVIGALPIRQRIMAVAFVDSEQQKRTDQQRQVAAEQQRTEMTQAPVDRQAALASGRSSAGNVVATVGEERAQDAFMRAKGGLSVLLDTLLWPLEQVTHVARIGALTTGAEAQAAANAVGVNAEIVTGNPLSGTGYQGGLAGLLPALWEATSDGFISQDSVNKLKSQYPAADVDTMLAYYRATQSDSETAMEDFYATISDNPQAQALIQGAIKGAVVGGDETGASLFVDIAAADQGNYGNLIANNLTLDPGTVPFSLLRDSVNVTAMFALDPLLWAGKVGKAVRVAKYGLSNLMTKHGGNIGKIILEEPAVNRAYAEFGASARRIAEANAAGNRSEAARLHRIHDRQFTSRESRFFDPVHTSVALDHELFTPEAWADFYGQIRNVEKVMAGQAIDVTTSVRLPSRPWLKGDKARKTFNIDSTVQQTEVVQQADEGAYNAAAVFNRHQAAQNGTRVIYMPHMTVAKTILQDLGKNVTWSLSSFSTKFDEAVRELAPQWDTLTHDQQIDALTQLLRRRDMAEKLGYSLSDFEAMSTGGKRTMAASMLDTIAGKHTGRERLARFLGLARKEVGKDGVERLAWTKGWQKKGWRFGMGEINLGEALLRRMERARKWGTTIPDARRGLEINDASEVGKVYQMAIHSGMGSAAADALRAFWIEATPAQRQLAGVGLMRSFLRASGVHVVDPAAEREILELMTGIRQTELHAPEQVYRYGGLMQDATRIANQQHESLRKAAEDAVSTHPDILAEQRAQVFLDDLVASTKAGQDAAALRDATFEIAHPNPDKPARTMRAGYTGENKLNRVPDGSTFPGNWKMDPDPFPVAHMEPPARFATATEDYLRETGMATDVPALDYQAVRVDPARQQQVANAYEALPVSDDAAKPYYDALIAETEQQAQFMEQRLGVTIEIVDKDPYANPAEMLRDVVENRRIKALSTAASNSSHPYLTDEQNDLFRAVHDFFGHALTGRGFDMHGEEAAWLAHSRMFSADARLALTTETRGQNSWHHVYGESKRFADQKLALLPAEFSDDAARASFPEVTDALKFGESGPAATRSQIAQARADLKAARAKAREARRSGGAPVPSVDELRRDILRKWTEPGGPLSTEARHSPSVSSTSGMSSALYPGQTSTRMYIPNYQVLDRYMARKSFMNALLFNNRAASTLTDLWVLGTLYGPRFQVRNGIEDAGMYALTGGRLGNFWRGRRIDQTSAAAIAREDRDFAAKRARFERAQRKLDELGTTDRPVTPRQLEAAQQEHAEAKAAFEAAEERFGRGRKLGLVRTALTRLSEKATYGPNGHVNDNVLARVAQFLVPTVSNAERRAAAEGGRDAVAGLATRATMRSKLVFVNDKTLNGLPYRIRRAQTLDDLSVQEREYLRYEEELLRSEYGTEFYYDASESTRHLSDGALPAVNDTGDWAYVDGQLFKRVFLNSQYETKAGVSGRLTEPQARAMMAHLRFMTERYGLTQSAMENLPDYWKAMNAAGVPDVSKMHEIIRRVLADARASQEWPAVRANLRRIAEEGDDVYVRNMLDDMANTFTTHKGEWNDSLYRALRTEDDKGLPYFRTWDDEAEEAVVHEMDFMSGKFDAPESLLMIRGDSALVPADGRGLQNLVNVKAWEPMGRSLARMTRNPIWFGNYVSARKELAALESKYADIFGAPMASKMVTDLAAERAYNLTMSYVDNPAIRTALAWQVRNIARYYRAQEDFARRLIRMGKFDPISYWKATLAWQATQEVGFVHTDQYGQEYFIYPFTGPALNVFSWMMDRVGLGTQGKFAETPMAFGGKVQWISPSADPEQWQPTLASPWSALTLQTFLRSMPFAQDFFKGVESQVFGDIAAQSDVDTPYNDFGGNLQNSVYASLPPNLKKVWAIGNSFFAKNDAPGTFGYRTAMKTLMATAAAGQLPSPEEWADERVRRDFMDTLQRRTVEVGIMSLIFGLFLPASPQYMEDAVTTAGREAGYESLRPAFRDMINSSLNAGEDYMHAYIRWTQANPQDGIFLTSQSLGAESGYIKPLTGNVDYIKDNRDVWNASPKGMVLFMPDTGQDSLKAFQMLRTFNATEWKPLERYATELANAEGYYKYKELDVAFAGMTAGMPKFLADGTANPEYKNLETALSSSRVQVQATYRGLDYRLSINGTTEESQWAADAKQIAEAARTLRDRGNAKARDAISLIEAFETVQAEVSRIERGYTTIDKASESRTMLGDIWDGAVKVWLGGNPSMSEDQRKMLVMTLTKAINGDWKVPEV